ncbi:MAG: 4-hydroxy-tetrahydrodipicolinate synthase [Anaerolineae bacterium]|nr:4-hydroxy-tetrahydrodipicolinate synthase [Anaerolineae bacterium]
MMFDSSQLRGVIPPLVTPMHTDGSLNLDAVPALVEHVLSQGVHGIFTPGSQGEAFALSADERIAVIEAVIAAVKGRVPVLAGTGAITTAAAVVMSRRAQEVGADAISVITPYFITPSQDELYAYYAEIAAAVSIPMLAYSNPMRTGGLRIAPATLARLAGDFPHFVGVKDSGGDLGETAAMIRACPDGFRVFVGRDTLVYGGLCYGTVGAVALTANVIPGLLVGVYEAFQAGDHARARELQDKVTILREGLPAIGSYPVPVKEALNLMGLPTGPTRRPILPLSDEARGRLRTLLQRVGVEVAG